MPGKKRLNKLGMGALTVLLLGACGNQQDLPQEQAHQEYPYTLTVDLAATDTPQVIESDYAGKVLIWDSEAGYALVGVSEAEAEPLAVMSSNKGRNKKAQRNTRAFSAGGKLAFAEGTLSAWAEGTLSAWAEGTLSAWAEGTFQPLPQNTENWNSIGLKSAQTAAKNLGAGVKVAVIDTGIDLAHPAFKGALAPATEMYDFVGKDKVPQEEGVFGQGAFGHGTNVAGIVLQIAPKATLLPIRVLGSDGSGYMSDVALAINHAVQQGAKVINLSLGSDQSVSAVSSAIASATAKGVYVVVSTGNTADSKVTFPATEAGLDAVDRSVMSVTSVNRLGVKSPFATYGDVVEIAAPGEKIYGPAPGNRKASWSGTSMAAPVVSGAIALALGEKASLKVEARDFTRALEDSAKDIDYIPANSAFMDKLGKGMTDLSAYLIKLRN